MFRHDGGRSRRRSRGTTMATEESEGRYPQHRKGENGEERDGDGRRAEAWGRRGCEMAMSEWNQRGEMPLSLALAHGAWSLGRAGRVAGVWMAEGEGNAENRRVWMAGCRLGCAFEEYEEERIRVGFGRRKGSFSVMVNDNV
ncbi:unnamed protein product [Linum trigynum]|uniref:Uncharacterized protein n=1 Tax=Linum trigynum TaxID=586398 RepID=A0AAV2G0E4_9ROSI